MRFVPLKNAQMQAVLALHRARQGFVNARTVQGNEIRGLLTELGIVIAQRLARISKRIPKILENGENGLPAEMRQLAERLGENRKATDKQFQQLEQPIKLWQQQNAHSRKLEKIPAIGSLAASALIASAGDAKQFHSARQITAWLAMVPCHQGTEGRVTLGGMRKARHCVRTHAVDSWGAGGDCSL